jgi:hypothetical protein
VGTATSIHGSPRGQYVDPRIGLAAIRAGQEPQRRAALGLCAAASGLHHTAEAAADDERAGAAEEPAHLLSQRRLVGVARTRANHGDAGPLAHGAMIIPRSAQRQRCCSGTLGVCSRGSMLARRGGHRYFPRLLVG